MEFLVANIFFQSPAKDYFRLFQVSHCQWKILIFFFQITPGFSKRKVRLDGYLYVIILALNFKTCQNVNGILSLIYTMHCIQILQIQKP